MSDLAVWRERYLTEARIASDKLVPTMATREYVEALEARVAGLQARLERRAPFALDGIMPRATRQGVKDE